MKKLRWVEQSLVPDVIGSSFFVLSFGWMCFEAIMRRMIGYSIEFSDEVVTFSLVWAVFLAIAQAGREGRHVRIELVVGRLSQPVQKGLAFFANIAGLLWGLVIALSATKFIPHLFLSGAHSSSSLRVPMWIMYLALLIGGITVALFYLEAAISPFLKREGTNP